ncbi:hypothetical protein CEE37_08390 [candidate division LCP-89 bacterium B3_LCP]|uniref:HTH cro/C1-type domain-containing protein n=1 Tax=candidate division LCP-89 bacterium B3_LCP TaxID=2012998 RepID=A0A532UZE7_UNCL8|nr:MAG: hypothetical protein CEE37_08390 [candidate division LCP-89 bacterium B3_LCP]
MYRQRSSIDMAEALKYWRAYKGLSQMKLAELANTSALTISQLESGKRRGRGATLEKILNGLNIGRDEFFSMRKTVAGTQEAVISDQPVEKTETTVVKKESASLRLSNLDLELLNRVLNLDFDAKLETLRYLQNLA